jgi:4-hydroxyacetophenone monooxygenase
MAEIWSRYALKAIVGVIEQGARSIEVKPAAFDAFNRALDEQNRKIVWETFGKGFYYLTGSGRSVVNTPWPNATVREMLFEPDLAEFDIN